MACFSADVWVLSSLCWALGFPDCRPDCRSLLMGCGFANFTAGMIFCLHVFIISVITVNCTAIIYNCSLTTIK